MTKTVSTPQTRYPNAHDITFAQYTTIIDSSDITMNILPLLDTRAGSELLPDCQVDQYKRPQPNAVATQTAMRQTSQN